MLERIETNQSWDEIRRAVNAYLPAKRKNITGELKEDMTLDVLKNNRDRVKDELKGLGAYLCCNEEEYVDDMQFLRPMIKALIKTAKLYKQNFDLIKKEKKVADFSDITHRALELLVEETPDGWRGTALAENL